MAKADESTYRHYTRSLLLSTGYRATWSPAESMELGAVGYLEDGRFRQHTRLRDFGVRFRTRTNPGKTSIEYQSSSGVSTTYKAAGDVKGVFQGIGTASAGVRFDFSRAGAVIFVAPDCTIAEIDDRRSLEKNLRALDEWEI